MQTYLVGGAVRDLQLGLQPKDRDWVIVGATEQDVQALLSQGYQQVGLDFPVFLHPETGEEHALARTERKTGIGYHGFEVNTENVTLEQDLARRDLTVNSMAMSPEGTLIDPFGGRSDLRNKILRHTSPAFVEDPLRVLRLARFAARMDWQIAQQTRELCLQLSGSGELNGLSCERIWVELEKGFNTDRPVRFVHELYDLGAIHGSSLLCEIFPAGLSSSQEELLRMLKHLPMKERFYVGVGALATGLPKTCNQRVRSCSRYAQALSHTITAEKVLSLISQAGGLQDSETFQDLVWTVLIHEAAGLCKLRADQLITGTEIIRQVKAAEFGLREGPELGAAIKAKRVHLLREICDLP